MFEFIEACTASKCIFYYISMFRILLATAVHDLEKVQTVCHALSFSGPQVFVVNLLGPGVSKKIKVLELFFFTSCFCLTSTLVSLSNSHCS